MKAPKTSETTTTTTTTRAVGTIIQPERTKSICMGMKNREKRSLEENLLEGSRNLCRRKRSMRFISRHLFFFFFFFFFFLFPFFSFSFSLFSFFLFFFFSFFLFSVFFFLFAFFFSKLHTASAQNVQD